MTPTPQGFRTPSERITFVHAELRRLGVEIPPTSRFDQAMRVFRVREDGAWTTLTASPEAAIALESFRDFIHMEFVLEHLPKRLAAGELNTFLDKLRVTVRKDDIDPAAPAKHTPGRNTMVELYVAATMAVAGLDHIAFTTPDIRVRLGGQHFFIEAKRPRSAEGVFNLLEKAAGQVAERGRPGAIFVDTALAWNPTNQRVIGSADDAEFIEARRLFLTGMIMPIAPQLQALLAGSPVGVVLFQDHVLRLVGDQGWRVQSTCMEVVNEEPATYASGPAKSFLRALRFSR